ncbi:MAG: substrate-binding domain-containing protein [Vallitalea sp.]|jgi:ribose transport system substrate-binding protein|nr:substrate-binding domain-containing protein [Vallitalea sp.]
MISIINLIPKMGIDMKKRFIKNTFIVIGIIFLISTVIILSNTSKNYKLIFIPKISCNKNDFWLNIATGANMGADEYGSDLQIVYGNNETDIKGQNEKILWAIKQNPDIILVSPCSYSENTETLRKVKKAGIKLVLVDSVIDEEIADIIITTNNIEAAKMLGEYAKPMLKKDSIAVIMGHVENSSTSIEREEGIRKGLEEKENCIKEVFFCDSNNEKAYKIAIDIIKKYPELDMIFGLNEESTEGITKAVADSCLSDQISILGFDNSKDEIQMMEQGLIDALIIQKPYNMGYLAVKEGITAISGKRFSDELYSGFKLINRDNMYTQQNQKLLFPFVNK